MGAGMNEKQVGGMLARLSPLTQYLPHEYAIVVSSERQAVDTTDIKGEELAYLRGGPMPTSTTIGARPASATAADGCCWGRNKWRMLRAKRLERAPGRLLPTPSSLMKRRTASLKMGRIFVAAPSTLRSEVAAHHTTGAHFLGSTDRGEAVAAMGEAFARFVSTRGDIDAMLGIG
jgi:hypothetical protein